MDSTTLEQLSMGFIVVWSAVCVLLALWDARSTERDPLPAEEPAPHDHH